MRRVLFIAAALTLAGCSCGNIHSSDELQRMETQPRYTYYQANPFFKDDRAMRTPPAGTIPREAVAGHPGIETGEENGQLVASVPVPVTPKMLAMGKEKFEIVCATCHGLDGDGKSSVAKNFPDRLPPAIGDMTDKPAGFFYRAATYGYGMMPSFSGILDTQERWAVVAYLQALQLSRHLPLASAPPDMQQRIRQHLQEEKR